MTTTPPVPGTPDYLRAALAYAQGLTNGTIAPPDYVTDDTRYAWAFGNLAQAVQNYLDVVDAGVVRRLFG